MPTFYLFNYFVCLEKMAQNIREEITRLHRRKQLNFTYHNVERMQDSESSGSEMGPDSPRRPDTPPNLRNPEKGLFTFKQVCHISNGYFRYNSCKWSSAACFSIRIDLLRLHSIPMLSMNQMF